MTKFKDVSVGERFEFDHTGLPIASGIAKGPWVKISARKYRHLDFYNNIHHVGTINVKISWHQPN